jgi:hypothetical protein
LILVQVPLLHSATVNCNENSVQSHTQSRQRKNKNTSKNNYEPSNL